jgi:UDP-N-acetylglucosamine 2-epimerase (non-hydrolysing)
MKVIAIVIGTRPEAIKLLPMVATIQAQFSHEFTPLVISTGQHQAVLDDVFQLFNIRPTITLTVDRSSKRLSSLQSQLVQALEAVFESERPNVVMVQGDTMSTLCGAMAAFYQRIPVAHVEAGLRSGSLMAPFPEEANRRMVTQLATWHFTPTQAATTALTNEGVIHGVHQVGNTVIDALLQVQTLGASGHPWAAQHSAKRPMMLVTIHRREHWGDGLRNVMSAVKTLVADHHQLDVVWLTHPNPDITKQVEQTMASIPNVSVYPPANYAQLVELMGLSDIILTDSGGIQEEAPSLNKPVLVARDVTERMEGVNAGCAVLVGTATDAIVQQVTRLLNSPDAYQQMTRVKNPYGDGKACERILARLYDGLMSRGY